MKTGRGEKEEKDKVVGFSVQEAPDDVRECVSGDAVVGEVGGQAEDLVKGEKNKDEGGVDWKKQVGDEGGGKERGDKRNEEGSHGKGEVMRGVDWGSQCQG